jgi:peptidoglycan hydrolase-like protein with peptidoglycan-binding domain
MRLTDRQIATYAMSAGFYGAKNVIAVAVCLAESGGDPDMLYRNTDARRTVDRGLMQINSHWHSEVTDEEALDPATAMREAYRISRRGEDWRPWSAFKNDKHLAFLQRAERALALGPAIPLSRYLKRGVYGDDVARLQHFIGDLTVDGDFGPKTHVAVLKLQARNYLDTDGIVGRRTAEAIGWVWTKP